MVLIGLDVTSQHRCDGGHQTGFIHQREIEIAVVLRVRQ